MPDVICAFVGHQEAQCGDQLADVLERARTGGAYERFQFGEGHFNRIEMGTVRRERSQMRPRLLNRYTDFGLFVDGEIVEHHDITSHPAVP